MLSLNPRYRRQKVGTSEHGSINLNLVSTNKWQNKYTLKAFSSLLLSNYQTPCYYQNLALMFTTSPHTASLVLSVLSALFSNLTLLVAEFERFAYSSLRRYLYEGCLHSSLKSCRKDANNTVMLLGVLIRSPVLLQVLRPAHAPMLLTHSSCHIQNLPLSRRKQL